MYQSKAVINQARGNLGVVGLHGARSPAEQLVPLLAAFGTRRS